MSLKAEQFKTNLDQLNAQQSECSMKNRGRGIPGSDLCPAGTGIRVGTGGWDGVGGGFGANTAGIAVDVECSRGVDGGADHAVEEGGIVVFLKQCCNKSV